MAEENINANEGGNESTFTQAEVDAIVAKRLARATKGMPNEDELKAWNAWKANQQSEAEKVKTIETERDTEKAARLAAEAKVTQYERERYLTSKGVGADELEFYCFKIGQKVTDTVTFEKAADAFLKERKAANVRVDTSAPVGGASGGTKTANDAMNALIRGKFK